MDGARDRVADNHEVDYVIAGAGSSGCVLANRLTQDGKATVALLEAGPRDTNIWLHIPVGYYRNVNNPKVAWAFDTEPDPGLNGRSVSWPRGKVLGGSSAINGLVYIRGQAEDYDHWRQLGNTGWGFADVLPYFTKAEGNQRLSGVYHGNDGPLGVSDAQPHELCEAFINAAVQEGIPRTDDFNGASQEGVGYFQLTTRNGWRSSTAVSYLRAAEKRANLQVITDALVERVVTSEHRAVGIRYRQGGITRTITARRDVILSAGALGSPQILMLSGIGPGEHLNEMGIRVVHALPGVGGNLQDHLQLRLTYRCTKPITVNDIYHNPLKQAASALEFAVNRTGPMTIGAGHVGLFARTGPHVSTPDVQFHFINFTADRPGMGLHRFPGFTVSVCQLRPESRGFLALKSSDPTAKPAIHANYLDARLDQQTMIDGVKLARRIGRAPPLKPYVAEELMPDPRFVTDAELLHDIRDRGVTVFHPVGTAKMAPVTDSMGVVDERLRVRGIDGLRVVDCSIMPTLVSGNTNAAAIMIAERAADLILADARRGV